MIPARSSARPTGRTVVRRRLLVILGIVAALVLVTWACGSDDQSDDGTPSDAPTTESDDGPPQEPPAFVPVTGGTNEDGQPEPPPIHAVFSVVVRGGTSWAPYTGPELTGLDVEATDVIATRLRQIEPVLAGGGIPMNVELAYGPAAALCEHDPGLLDDLVSSGHAVGIHARSIGEVLRAHEALEACGHRATTVSGLAWMADPLGPGGPSSQGLLDAMGVLSVLDVRQVVGEVAPLCAELGLAEPTHGYGTGAFNAPWRSGWTEERPCSDLPRGRIVIIDQTALAPADDNTWIDSPSLGTLTSRTEQVLAYALDLRFAEPDALPPPGIITWGVTVRLQHLTPPPVDTTEADEADEADEGPGGANGEEVEVEGEADTPPTTIDQATAPLSDETLAELALLIEERWRPSMDQGRLSWMLPDDLALMLRPLPDLEVD